MSGGVHIAGFRGRLSAIFLIFFFFSYSHRSLFFIHDFIILTSTSRAFAKKYVQKTSATGREILLCTACNYSNGDKENRSRRGAIIHGCLYGRGGAAGGRTRARSRLPENRVVPIRQCGAHRADRRVNHRYRARARVVVALVALVVTCTVFSAVGYD